jgi:hypothetical protein
MNSQEQERRKFPRAAFLCKIAVGSPIRWLTSHTENLSAGGIKVILDEKLNVYTTVGLEIFFEKDKSIKCKGRVAWVEEEVNPLEMASEPIIFITGIEFAEISDNDKQYIKRLIKVLSFRKKK